MALFWQATGLASIILSAMVIWNALRNGFFRFSPAVVLYCAIVLASDFPSFIALVEPGWLFPKRHQYVIFYWTCEATLQLATFALIVGLLARLLPYPGRWVYLSLAALASTVVMATLAYLSGSEVVSLSGVMTPLIRNLTFVAALLNLVLWSLILRTHPVDRLLLLVAAGAGLLTAGKTIGHAMRWLAGVDPNIVLAGNVVIVVTGVISLLVWWQASRQLKNLTITVP
ncbi:MAG: hypothetical protein R2762_25345 [Bryobacteraceae bacterium]